MHSVLAHASFHARLRLFSLVPPIATSPTPPNTHLVKASALLPERRVLASQRGQLARHGVGTRLQGATLLVGTVQLCAGNV